MPDPQSSNLGVQRWKCLERSASGAAASRAPHSELMQLAETTTACISELSPRAQSPAGPPMHSLWVLSGFASSSDRIHTGRNKAKCLANHLACKSLSRLQRPERSVCFLGSWHAAVLVKASAGARAGEADRPGASWGILESCSLQARGKAATSWASLDPAGKGRIS